ncbi:MAG: ABC transporter permease [Gemmatimonadota bacterium]|nr:ABC transporter permease [Gemmatimonadota bacterium]MDH3368765.1 ABC transporter permease [Gemmatimonadota bacterium]MDH3476674.1 ABC transporter permease [Gemmatimonadota bacterium]MDH3570456.1 ABC transporter permease [Gemmatimonadota bacterium]MDH5550984.1 ABC transporter permease [Gemmatimonadota bacterium]
MRRAKLLARLALRNVRRQTRRSILTASAMVLGVAVLVFSRALGDGAHEDWIDQGVRLGKGHIAIQHPRFQQSRHLDDRLTPRALALAERALAEPDIAARVTAVAPRLEIQGLANSATGAIPVFVTGVDPEIEAGFSKLGDRVVEGRYLEDGDRLHAFVGQRLAERLDLELDSRLVLTGQDATGEIAGQFVRVVGIFRTGLPEADEGIVHIPLRTAQEWLQVGGAVTTLAVLVASGWDMPAVLDDLDAALAEDASEVAALGWREAMPELDAAIRIDDYGDYLFHLILFVIVGLAIVNTVLMSVLYRTREFGVLRALGLTKGETAGVVFGEGVLLTLVSGLLGMVVGFAFTWVFFRNGLDYSGLLDSEFTISGILLEPVIVPIFRMVQVFQSLGSIVVIGVLASLYPAYRATRIDVAEAMKFEA